MFEVDRAAREPGLDEADLAAGELGEAEADRDAGEPALSKPTVTPENPAPKKETVLPANLAPKSVMPPENSARVKSTLPPENSAPKKETVATSELSAQEGDRTAGELRGGEVDLAAAELGAGQADRPAGEPGSGEVAAVKDHPGEVEVQALPGHRRALLDKPLRAGSFVARIGLVRHAQIGAQHIDAGLPVLGPVIRQARHDMHPGESDRGRLITAQLPGRRGEPLVQGPGALLRERPVQLLFEVWLGAQEVVPGGLTCAAPSIQRPYRGSFPPEQTKL